MKRTLKFTIMVETTLDDDALTRLAAVFGQDATKDCGGRMVVTGGVVDPVQAQKLWNDLKLPEKPAPDAVLWNPKEKGS